jgi:putative two-component system response regulator
MGIAIALNHHEKFDGSGYPNGLKGESIPLEARIVSVADVFDALLSKRPYKEPFTIEETLRIINEGRGKHFDPFIIDVFNANLERLMTIQHLYLDTH